MESTDINRRLDQRACFHYTNLQCLWSKDNMRKGSKYQANQNQKDP